LVVVNKLRDIKAKVDSYTAIKKDYQDVTDLISSTDATDKEMCSLIETTKDELNKKIQDLRNILLFSGEYDDLNATLEIHPGAGGTEAQDWADMLLRMYGRWAERHGFTWQVLSYEAGEEAGLKSAVVKVSGHNAYGLLKARKACTVWCASRPSMPTRAVTLPSPR
jgi:peptide chain release factor 2